MPENIRLQLGRKIKEFRKIKGITQQKLAESANIDYKYLQRIEGKRPPNITVETLARIAKALKINPSDLLNS